MAERKYYSLSRGCGNPKISSLDCPLRGKYVVVGVDEEGTERYTDIRAAVLDRARNNIDSWCEDPCQRCGQNAFAKGMERVDFVTDIFGSKVEEARANDLILED